MNCWASQHRLLFNGLCVFLFFKPSLSFLFLIQRFFSSITYFWLGKDAKLEEKTINLYICKGFFHFFLSSKGSFSRTAALCCLSWKQYMVDWWTSGWDAICVLKRPKHYAATALPKPISHNSMTTHPILSRSHICRQNSPEPSRHGHH